MIQYNSECPLSQTYCQDHVYQERYCNNYIQLYTFLLFSLNCHRIFKKLGMVGVILFLYSPPKENAPPICIYYSQKMESAIAMIFVDIPDSMTMLGQRWYRVVRLAYGWGWKYNVGPTLPQR